MLTSLAVSLALTLILEGLLAQMCIRDRSWVQSLMGNISFFQLGHSPVK